MISLQLILSSLVIAFVAELGDKTQLIAFSLTSKTGNMKYVFLASSLALISSTILAAFAGKVFYALIPGYLDILSGALFVGIGFYILISKPVPLIKDCFLQSIVIERQLIKHLSDLFKKEGHYNYEIMDIIRQEYSHIELLKILIRERKLFKDDINEEEGLEELQNYLKKSKPPKSLSFSEALSLFIQVEKTQIKLYEYICDHLDLEHHHDTDLQKLLEQLINEEKQHVDIFKRYAEEDSDQNT